MCMWPTCGVHKFISSCCFLRSAVLFWVVFLFFLWDCFASEWDVSQMRHRRQKTQQGFHLNFTLIDQRRKRSNGRRYTKNPLVHLKCKVSQLSWSPWRWWSWWWFCFHGFSLSPPQILQCPETPQDNNVVVINILILIFLQLRVIFSVN